MYTDKKEHNSGFDAYFTLEAAFLVPAAFFLLAFVIHLAFMMYGRAQLVPDAYLPVMRAGYLGESEDVIAFASSQARTQTGEKYFGNRQPAYTVQKEGKYITATLESATNRTAFDLATEEAWEIRTGARAIHIDVPKRIRRIDRIADIAALALRGKGGNGNSGVTTEGE